MKTNKGIKGFKGKPTQDIESCKKEEIIYGVKRILTTSYSMNTELVIVTKFKYLALKTIKTDKNYEHYLYIYTSKSILNKNGSIGVDLQIETKFYPKKNKEKISTFSLL